MIDNIVEFPKNIFSLVKKSFEFQNGALVAVAIPSGYGAKGILEIIFNGVDIKEFALPIISFGVLTIMYIAISTVDFYTGTRASRKEHIISAGTPIGYIKSDKLWSSVWKFLGVILTGTALMIFCLLFILIGMNWLSETFLIFEIGFFIVVIGFDLHSIGENQLRRYGKKPAFYGFIDEVSVTIRKGIIEKISNKLR
jgi:hypothetical protein